MLLLAATREVRADEPVETVRFSTTMYTSVNPFIAVPQVQLSYQHRLYQTSSPLLHRNFLEASASLALGPFFAPRLRLAIHPASFFDLGISYGANVLFIKAIEERPSPTSPYEVNIVGFDSGHTITLQSFNADATLQGGVGRLIVRAATSLSYTAASLAPGNTVYYSAAADLLLPARSWLLSNDTTIAYAISPRLRLGATETLFATWYPESAYPSGEPRSAATNGPSLRVGPSFSATLRDQGTGPLARVDLFGSVQWYVVDRYRTGAAISVSPPGLTAPSSTEITGHRSPMPKTSVCRTS